MDILLEINEILTLTSVGMYVEITEKNSLYILDLLYVSPVGTKSKHGMTSFLQKAIETISATPFYSGFFFFEGVDGKDNEAENNWSRNCNKYVKQFTEKNPQTLALTDSSHTTLTCDCFGSWNNYICIH